MPKKIFWDSGPQKASFDTTYKVIAKKIDFLELIYSWAELSAKLTLDQE